MKIYVDTQGGSSGGISALGEGRVELGMSSKGVSPQDRQRYPEVDFREIAIGADAVAVVVSRDVWRSGVKALSRGEIQAIYEKRIRNWKEVGGADQRILFYNKEPGRGTWEVFADWLYGDSQKAPLVSFPRVGGNEEGRTKVASSRGAMTQLSASWADEKTVFALGIETEQGDVIRPTAENIARDRYPIIRPLYLLTDGKPKGLAKKMVDFMLNPRGQELVRKHGYLSLDELERDEASLGANRTK